MHYISGFADLAKVIASDIDGDAAIFKRFDTLGARNLIYLQSELAELEALQRQFDLEDAADRARADMWQKIGPSTRDWGSFVKGADVPTSSGDRLKKRMDLVIAIREKLKEYRASEPSQLDTTADPWLRRSSRHGIHDTFAEKTFTPGP